jgi:hypothetical protein
MNDDIDLLTVREQKRLIELAGQRAEAALWKADAEENDRVAQRHVARAADNSNAAFFHSAQLQKLKGIRS